MKFMIGEVHLNTSVTTHVAPYISYQLDTLYVRVSDYLQNEQRLFF